jgi:hypothetical protein
LTLSVLLNLSIYGNEVEAEDDGRVNLWISGTVPESVTISSWDRPLLPNWEVSCWTLDLEEGSAALAASMLETVPSQRPVAMVRGRPWKFSPAWKRCTARVRLRDGVERVE